MPKVLSVHTVGSKGINLDVNSDELDPEYLSGGVNFRIANQSVENIKGANLYTTPTSFVAGLVKGVKCSAGNFIIAAGRVYIKVFNGSAWYDISPTGFVDLGAGTELLWSDCTLGQIPILNNSASYPMYWSPQATGTKFQYLEFSSGVTWSAATKSCKVVRSHGTFLFALNLTESATAMPDSFRWSHPADTNGLPFTWDETDLSGIAGIASVGAGGALVDGMSMRENFVLYSQTAINVLRPSGDEFVWSKTVISDTIGLAAKNAVVEADSLHYFISQDDFMVFDGVSPRSIAHQRIQRTMRGRANKQYWNTCYALKNPVHSEIWFCVPEGVSTLPNTAYVYNYRDDSWSIRDIPSGIAHIAYAPKTLTGDTWAADDGTWANFDVPWDYTQYADDLPIGVINSTGVLYTFDDPVSTGTSAMTIERQNLQIGNLDTAATITRVYPRMLGDVECTIQFGSHDYPGAPVRWGLQKTFNPASQRKVELRTTGKLHAYQITCTNAAKLTFSGFDLEYEMAGNR